MDIAYETFGAASGAPSHLFWQNINLYGRFRLDMNTRLDLPVPSR